MVREILYFSLGGLVETPLIDIDIYSPTIIYVSLDVGYVNR